MKRLLHNRLWIHFSLLFLHLWERYVKERRKPESQWKVDRDFTIDVVKLLAFLVVYQSITRRNRNEREAGVKPKELPIDRKIAGKDWR